MVDIIAGYGAVFPLGPAVSEAQASLSQTTHAALPSDLWALPSIERLPEGYPEGYPVRQ